MSKAIAAQFEEVKRRLEQKNTGADPNAIRVVITGKPISCNGRSIAYPSLEPYHLYPLYTKITYDRGSGVQGEVFNAQTVEETIRSGRKEEKVYPHQQIGFLMGSYGSVGDTENDWGLREVTPLFANEDMEYLQNLESIIYPEEVVGNPSKIHARLERHLESVIEEFGADSVEGKVAEIALDSNNAAREWKLAHFRTLADETGEGGREVIKGVEIGWKDETGAEMPEQLRVGGAMPGDKEYKGTEKLLQSLVDKLQPQAPPADIQKMIDEAVAAALAAQGVTKAKK